MVDEQPLTMADLAAAAGRTPWVRGPGRVALVFGDRLTLLTLSARASNARFRSPSGWAARYQRAQRCRTAIARAMGNAMGKWAGSAVITASRRSRPLSTQRMVDRLLPFQNRVVNPLVVALAERGWVLPTYALVETVGRRTGRVRRVPVANGLDGDTFWLIAALGERASFVRNLRADPRVRVLARPARLRDGLRMRWRSGTANPLPDDDPRERHRKLSRGRPAYRFDGIFLHALATPDMLTVRIDLD